MFLSFGKTSIIRNLRALCPRDPWNVKQMRGCSFGSNSLLMSCCCTAFLNSAAYCSSNLYLCSAVNQSPARSGYAVPWEANLLPPKKLAHHLSFALSGLSGIVDSLQFLC